MSKESPRRPQGAQRRPQGAPRRPQGAPRSSQGVPLGMRICARARAAVAVAPGGIRRSPSETDKLQGTRPDIGILGAS